MTEDIRDLFSEHGDIGRLLAGFTAASFADETLYAVADRIFPHVCGKDGEIRVCRMDEYFACRDKESRFLAGDVIWRAQIVTDALEFLAQSYRPEIREKASELLQ